MRRRGIPGGLAMLVVAGCLVALPSSAAAGTELEVCAPECDEYQLGELDSRVGVLLEAPVAACENVNSLAPGGLKVPIGKDSVGLCTEYYTDGSVDAGARLVDLRLGGERHSVPVHIGRWGNGLAIESGSLRAALRLNTVP